MVKRANSFLSAIRRRSRTAGRVIKSRGLHGVADLLKLLAQRSLTPFRPAAKPLVRAEYAKTTKPAREIFATRVLIIATLDIPQCEKYRVKQKQMLLKLLGIDSTVVPIADYRACMNAIQTHSIVIFYRVPGYEHVLSMIREAKRLGVPTIYEVDDLIFDLESYLHNPNIYRLTDDLRRSVLDGVPLFRKALENCDFGIASTEDLATKMKQFGLKDVDVIENGIDQETLAIASRIEADLVHDRTLLRIFYGSGSKAHDADFDRAAASVLALARENPHIRVRIVGDLTPPKAFDSITRQIERYPITDYEGYLRLLAECDINLAPLEPGIFNDCKSNIKFIEASLFAIPSICSPRTAFRDMIVSGDNGFLAETVEQWRACLTSLVGSDVVRVTMGRRAKQTVLLRYSPSRLAERDVRRFIERYASDRKTACKVLMVNIYFSPDSFGGGTIVAEEMATRINARQDSSVLVFSSSQDATLAPHEIVRHEQKGLPVISLRLPHPPHAELSYHNRKVKSIFAELLASYRPDVVHLHSIQGLGASIADECKQSGIPYVVTLHDAWWLCERQFMVKPDHTYCGQTRIDMDVCETCVWNIDWTELRFNYLRGILKQAARLLAPSEFWRRIYIANGISPDQISVNKNGIRMPLVSSRGTEPRNASLRFGFVGGLGPIKGFDLIIKAFQKIERRDYELVLVDNTLNLGFSSIHAKGQRIPGKLKIVPAYTQDTIDEFFSQIDVLLFPTQWKESFGLTVREALIRNKWVILTDSGGTVEDIVDGENGTIIPLDGDYVSLKTAIVELLQKADEIVGHVNQYKKQICSFEQQADELHGFLRDVAGPGSTPVLK